MLEKNVKVGTSTPKADPSGDYAFEVFRKADAVKAGAQAELEKKALQLTGTQSARRRPQVAPSMVGMFRKAAPISF